MAPRYQYRRARKLQSRSKRNFFVTIFIIIALLYIAFFWILPNLIGGVGIVKNATHPTQKQVNPQDEATLAPPTFNIPYEATNTAQIDISGYAAANSKVELFLDNGKKDTIDVGDDGSFIFKDVLLSIGTNNIYGKSVDEKGVESLPSKTIVLLYDNIAPSLDISEPDDNKTIQGGDKKVKISGKTEVGANVFVNGTQLIVDKDGNFSTTLDINEGDNNFNIKAVDSASNSTEISRKTTYTP